jgi:hypothetical protein
LAAKNVGITLLGVVVAIGAFVASNIWAQSLHENVDRLTNATNEWNAAYNSVNDKEIDLKANATSDLPGVKLRLQHRLEHAKQLDDASLKLTQAGAGSLADDEALIKITKHIQKISEQSSGLDSADSAAALDKEAAKLLEELSARGVLRNLDALDMMQDSEREESRVKYTGYSLSILAIIVAAIAQLTGKTA